MRCVRCAAVLYSSHEEMFRVLSLMNLPWLVLWTHNLFLLLVQHPYGPQILPRDQSGKLFLHLAPTTLFIEKGAERFYYALGQHTLFLGGGGRGLLPRLFWYCLCCNIIWPHGPFGVAGMMGNFTESRSSSSEKHFLMMLDRSRNSNFLDAVYEHTLSGAKDWQQVESLHVMTCGIIRYKINWRIKGVFRLSVTVWCDGWGRYYLVSESRLSPKVFFAAFRVDFLCCKLKELGGATNVAAATLKTSSTIGRIHPTFLLKGSWPILQNY